VNPISLTQDNNELQVQLGNLTKGEDNVINKLSDEGDVQGLLQLVGTVSNALNAATEVKDDDEGETLTDEKKRLIVEQRTQVCLFVLVTLKEVVGKKKSRFYLIANHFACFFYGPKMQHIYILLVCQNEREVLHIVIEDELIVSVFIYNIH